MQPLRGTTAAVLAASCASCVVMLLPRWQAESIAKRMNRYSPLAESPLKPFNTLFRCNVSCCVSGNWPAAAGPTRKVLHQGSAAQNKFLGIKPDRYVWCIGMLTGMPFLK